jgi:ABC-type Fe3+-hydroxamate transport system substrate-binding protein
LANDYENHMQFTTNFLQHLLNYLKNYFLTDQGQREAELFLSLRSLHLLKVTENLAFDNLATFVDMRDNMSDIERQQIVGIAQTVLPTGNIEALMALVKIQNASTKTDVINELEYFAERKLKEQQQQQQQQAMMQAAAIAQQGDNANQQQQLKNEGAVQAKQAEAEGRIANTMVQQGIQE